MLSKVFNSSLCGLFKTQPIIVSTGYTFCTSSSSRYESHPLRNKILSITSFDEFNTFFKEKNKQFDPSCYSVASRTLAKILIDTKPYFTFQHRESIKTYLSQLQKIDIDALSLQQFSQLLYLLRIIKLDPNNTNTFVSQYIKLILERSENKIKELELDASLNRLSYFYQEYSSLGSRQAASIVKRINNLLQTGNSETDSQILSVNEINLILKGMKCKPQLSTEEQILLRTIVKMVIDKHFDKLSFLELAQISVGINEVLFNSNTDIVNASSVQQIHKKVFTNIDDMDEKSIMYILNSKKTNNKTYNQIYKTIFERILEEIQPNGESSFNELFTLRLFNGISDKVRLGSTTPENQEKFFAFLKATITKTPRFIHSFVENFIQKGFFNYKQLLRVQEILESIPDFHLKLSLIYLLSKKRINVEKMLSMDSQKEYELKEKNLIMMSSIIEKLAQKQGPNKEKFIETLGKLKTRFFELYKVEDDSFNKLIFGLSTEHLSSLYQTFRKELEAQLPNPFETEQTEKYRLSWLKLHLHGCSESFFNKRFGNQLKDKLTNKDFEFIFRTFSIDGYDNIQSLCNALTLVSKRVNLIASNDQLASSLAKLMSQQMSSIFSENSSDFIKIRFWHVLSDCMEKMEPSKFLESFSFLISNILKSRIYDFKYSSQYQSLLLKLLPKTDFIKSRYMASELLDECLKNNLIKREHIRNLSQKIKDSASNNQNMLLKMIQNNTFALQGVEVTKQNLYMFLFNLSPETSSFISINHDKIVGLIEQMKPREVWKCITHFRLGSKKNQTVILEALFKQLNKFSLYFEQFSPIFLGDVLRRNNFDKFLTKIDNVKQFYKNSLDYFIQRRNINKIPLEDHVELIKTTNDFKIRSDDYVHAVFENYSSDLNIFKRELYLVAGHIGVELNKKEIQRLIDYNFFITFTSSFSKCFNIFIYNEKQLENPGTHLQTIIKKYNELKATEKVPIYSSYFEYLKKVYPEETKDFEPNHIEAADFCRSLEAINNRNLNSLRETVEEITQEKWVENNISGNYYYTFRNIAIIFPVQSKYYGENNLIKKIITTLTGIDKIALINRRQNNLRSIVKFLTQSFNGILTLEEEDKILKKLDEKYQQSKAHQEEAQSVEEVEQQPTPTEQAEKAAN